MVETIAGKGTLTHYDPVHAGPIGVVGSTSANALAAAADVILAIGTRLQDFTTGSWTAFARDARFISINAARWDATKHRAVAVVGDALETIRELDAAAGDWTVDPAHLKNAQTLFREWDALLVEHQKQTNAPVPTYAQVVDVVNRAAGDDDHLVAAAGGIPGEVAKGWRVKRPNTFDLEFGFSCMGYEIAGGWGNAMANAGKSTPIVMVGDGGYLMMNSDIYSSVLTGHKMIVVVCDNGGFASSTACRSSRARPASTTCGRTAGSSTRTIPCTSTSRSTPRPWAPMRATARASPTSKPRSNGPGATTGPPCSPSRPTPAPGYRVMRTGTSAYRRSPSGRRSGPPARIRRRSAPASASGYSEAAPRTDAACSAPHTARTSRTRTARRPPPRTSTREAGFGDIRPYREDPGGARSPGNAEG